MIANPAELVVGCPPEYRMIKQLIDTYGYYDTPDYNQIYMLMRKTLANRGLRE